MLDVMQIGMRIRELRKGRGLTQQAFAKEMNVSFQAVSGWERGVTPPDLENLIRIASYFGVLVDDLLSVRGKKLVLGVDGGGSKTSFAVSTLDGTVLDIFTKEGSNPNDIGIQRTLRLVGDGIAEALFKFPEISSVFCGIAGASTAGYDKKLTQYLTERFPPLKITVKTDSANIFGMDDKSDMALISGTGSVVFVRRGDIYVRLGGWGYLLDKAGSAYDIGRDALACALEEEDMNMPLSYMSELLREKLGASRLWDAIGNIYSGGRPYIALLADVVFKAYENGDKKAEHIIDSNTERLGELLDSAVRLYNVKPRAIAGGGLFEHHSDIMLRHLSLHTSVEVKTTGLPPVYGACRESAKLIGGSVSDDFCDNFKISYKVIIK